MTGIVAVHCGAGHHNSKLYKEYRKLCNRACQKGVQVLLDGGSAMDAVKAAIIVLENDPLTNAGFGANLTMDGIVENDASIMDGKTLTYGGCGAVRKVKNPIMLAHDICIKQSEPLPLGLVPPSLIVGTGGLRHAQKAGLRVVKNHQLISEKARRQFIKYKKLLDSYENKNALMDTVGAICVDSAGHVASGCSSGGLLLKRPGRVGQAALYASGSWADSFDLKAEPSVAVSTTGCGEHLVQTQLAKEIAADLKRGRCPTTDLANSMTNKFINSRYLKKIQNKMAGALVVHVNNENGEVSLLWGHSTETMGVGYMKTSDQKPKSTISILPRGVPCGQTINVSGTFFCRKDLQNGTT